jgi:hypothetical protein
VNCPREEDRLLTNKCYYVMKPLVIKTSYVEAVQLNLSLHKKRHVHDVKWQGDTAECVRDSLNLVGIVKVLEEMK